MHTKGAGSILHNNGNFKPQLNYKFLKNFLGTIMKPMKHIVEHPRYRSLTILAANSQVLIRLRNIRFSVLLFFSLWRLFCTQLQLRFNLTERSTIRFHWHLYMRNNRENTINNDRHLRTAFSLPRSRRSFSQHPSALRTAITNLLHNVLIRVLLAMIRTTFNYVWRKLAYSYPYGQKKVDSPS